jgi:glutaredoxin-like YruB-family protein
MDREVVVYSTPACPYCKMAKDYLSGKNIPFREVDVAADREAAKKMIEASGEMGVPQIVIGEDIIVGFDRETVDKALEKVGR